MGEKWKTGWEKEMENRVETWRKEGWRTGWNQEAKCLGENVPKSITMLNRVEGVRREGLHKKRGLLHRLNTCQSPYKMKINFPSGNSS